jgi:excisionase family DNA binding protein
MTVDLDIRQLAAEIATLIAERQAPAALLDADQAAATLNVPASWCMAEARAGRLPHIKVGRYVRFRRDDLEAWLERRAAT